MTQAREYGFQDRLVFSQGIAEKNDIAEILLGHIPDAASIERSQLSDDRNGTDYWVYRNSGTRPISVDVKRRDLDPVEKGWGDDVALETWSDVDRQKVGWTLDDTKETDYVMWLWEPTSRWMLVPFVMLRAVFEENKEAWTSVHKVSKQLSDKDGRYWFSECVFVPRKDIWTAIYRRYGGAPGVRI